MATTSTSQPTSAHDFSGTVDTTNRWPALMAFIRLPLIHFVGLGLLLLPAVLNH